MPDLLQTGGEWLANQQSTHASRPVTYRRGSRSTATTIAATKCPPSQETDSEFGRQESTNQDWLITASLIVIDSETVLPAKNDVIEEAGGARWQVLPISSEQHYRELIGGKLRIHTKRIDAE